MSSIETTPSLIARAGLLTTLLSLLTFYLGFLIIKHFHKTFFGPLSKFPGPKIHAISIIPWSRTTWRGTDHTDLAALHAQYGEVVRFGPNDLSFVGNHQTWKDVYGFRKQGGLTAIKDPIFYGKPPNKEVGLFTADDQNHARQRKIVSHAFSDKALKEQESLLKTWVTKLQTKLAAQVQRGQDIDMAIMLACVAFDMMSDLAFSEPLDMLDDSKYVSFVESWTATVRHGTQLRAFRIISSFINWALDEISFQKPSFRKSEMEFFQSITDRVDKRLVKTPDRLDLWSVILERGGHPVDTRKQSRSPSGMTLQEHYLLAGLFMSAGTETIATALSGTVFHLLKHPQHLHNLQQEVRASFDSIDEMQLDSLARLPILEATLKEGLRMHPPVAIGLPRVSPPGGVVVAGHLVPEGASFAVHQFSTYRSEENFKQAYEFRPERWLGDPAFKDDKLDAVEPFSVGPRNCLGKNLAWHELRMILASVVLHFDMELCQSSQSWSDQKVFTLWDKPPLMCKLTPAKV